MTHEMLRSEAPCAMALMLMLWRPSEPNTLPETPGRPFIPSPTTATIAWSSLTSTLRQLLVQLEPELLLDRVDRRGGVGAAHAKADRVLGRGLGDQDDVDAPGGKRPEQTLGDAGHADHARAAQRQQRQVADRGDALAPASRRPRPGREISVPGASGLNVFLIRIGMRFATAGAIVAECSTFAPK